MKISLRRQKPTLCKKTDRKITLCGGGLLHLEEDSKRRPQYPAQYTVQTKAARCLKERRHPATQDMRHHSKRKERHHHNDHASRHVCGKQMNFADSFLIFYSIEAGIDFVLFAGGFYSDW
jgi:hypothetical protein